MSTIRVNAIQHTTANASNMTLFANGNVAMTTANTVLTVGNTTISNSGISVGATVISNAGISVGGAAISQYSGMMKNRIINGDFRIDQRFNGAANNNIPMTQYVVDRWASAGGIASKLRFQQNNTNGPGSSATLTATGFPNYFGANTISANAVISTDNWQTFQFIEGLNIADLGWGTANAQPVTLSFWSYSSIAGTHAGSIRNGVPDRSYVFTFNVAAANTWQYQTITVPGDTTGSWFSNNGIGINLAFSYGVGSDKQTTAGSWTAGNYISTSSAVASVASANGALYFTGVQLEKGSQATPFEFRHYGTELALCQRYYEVLPVNSGDADTNYIGQIVTSTLGDMGARFTVTKRNSTPTITLNSITQVRQGINNITPSGGFSITYTTSGTASIRATHSGWTPGQVVTLIGGSGSPSITASAELSTQN